jgi:transcriptional regulator GlxA family with amidase domain
MKHVSILVAKEAVLACVDDPRSLVSAVNDFLTSAGKEPMFNVQLVGATREVPLHNGLFTVHTDALLQEVRKTDLVFVPALACDYKTGIEKNKELIPWIQQQYENGAEVASLCIGAFLLASTGLLQGKKCSTHWLHANNFRAMFPDVELTDDKIVTEDGGIFTSGGANSYWNLLVYLIEKHTDRETAIFASKYFAIEIDRDSQSPFTVFKGQKGHDDEPIKKAQEFIESNYQEKISVEQLAYMFALGRRSLERRFKKATNNTIAEYIQRVKMEAAKKDLESSRKNINEVMFDVGYSDTKAFRTTFKKVTGLSPIEYRNKYNKNVAFL